MADGGNGGNGLFDPRERYDHEEETDRRVVEADRTHLWTSLPAAIHQPDDGRNVVQIQPTIKLRQFKPDGSDQWVQMPILQDVPIYYPSGGGVTLVLPVKQGDEGLAIFASRSIDK